MTKIMLTLAATLLIAAPGYAADSVAGKWTGDTQNPGGNKVDVSMELKVSGPAVTGSVTTGSNPTVEIRDGTVVGDKVSFNIIRSVQGVDAKIKWTGDLKGDFLVFNREITGTDQNDSLPAVALRRVK